MNTNSSHTKNQNQPQTTRLNGGNANVVNSPGFLMKRLWFFSGANVKVLEQCQVDHDKYAGIGFTILLTSVLASISGGYALWTVFNSTFMAGVFGGFWGLTIGSLDRFLVSTMRKEKKMSERQLFITSIRITIAIVIAIVVVKPLEMKIFEKPIQLKLTEQHDEEAKDYEKSLMKRDQENLQNSIKSQYDDLSTQVKNWDKEQKQAYKAVISEAEGTSGSYKLGKGPVYDKKWQKYQQALEKFQEYQEQLKTLMDEQATKSSQLNSEREAKVQKFREQQGKTNDIMTQFVTLHELGESKQLYALASKFITLVFILLDVTPILAKVLLEESAYDIILKEEEEKQKELGKSSTELEKFKQLANDALLKQESANQIDVGKSSTELEKFKQLANDALLKQELENQIEIFKQTLDFEKKRGVESIKLEVDAYEEVIKRAKQDPQYQAALNAAIVNLIEAFRSSSGKWSHGATPFSRSSGNNTAGANASNGRKI
jgi:hypothetical protein